MVIEATTTPRVLIYARLSRNKAGLSQSVEFQIAECTEFARAQGWEIVGTFSDDDISASKYSTKPRPGYNGLIAGLHDGRGDVVLVTEASRLYRRLEELIDVILLARSTPLRKIWTTADRGFDLATDEGIRNAVNAVYEAAEESRRIAERVSRSKRNLARTGRFNGGRRPYGYEGAIRDENGNIINRHRIGIAIIEEEAAIIRRVTKSLLEGQSLRSVTAELNKEGVPTAGGTEWHSQKLSVLLRSPRLKGVRVHRGKEYPALWEPILDPDTWEALQLVLKAGAATTLGKKAGRKYLLTGQVFCARCGNRMVGSSRNDGRGTPLQRRYVCLKTDDYGRQRGCGKAIRRAEPLDELVTEALLYRCDAKGIQKLLTEAMNSDSAEQVQELLRERAEEKAKLVEMAEAFAKGLMRIEQVTTATPIVEETIDRIERKLQQLSSNRVLASIPEGGTVKSEWERRGDDWRRGLLGVVVDRVNVQPDPNTRVVWRGWRFDPSKVEIRWKV
jgi:site-specific DNA recombinase